MLGWIVLYEIKWWGGLGGERKVNGLRALLNCVAFAANQCYLHAVIKRLFKKYSAFSSFFCM
jgi:hypothetical protein